ncbi:hypothetical protein GCM10008018_33180 [Paenibacillus marchantiophytorum]|uniref:Uncharacterized protein n=1 Tax=Paenibacillus marchantiophytorum TaxID=1619310 RepID=A0ABQ1ERQ9_9BACL|nr:hypothetical protein [Paenibacillus marchantiophytorum]GFZ84381.1 hypothetical protein GCM10008018_33180 [Paenibacillus marchantiophytorum]
MPYVLQHKASEQLFTCQLVNHYGLAYYGVKFWLEQDEAVEQFASFVDERLEQASHEWQVVEIEEGEMKLCNVKLKNDPNLLVFWPHTRKPEVRKLEN